MNQYISYFGAILSIFYVRLVFCPQMSSNLELPHKTSLGALSALKCGILAGLPSTLPRNNHRYLSL